MKFIPIQRGYLFRLGLAAIAGAGLAAVLNGCAQISEGVGKVGLTTGTFSTSQLQSLVRTGEAFGKAIEQITPEQEYFVGRAVGATIVTKYSAYNSDAATEYINVVGQTLAAASDRPETFRGYHFLILNTDEINAFAAPGGFVFVSRGMLRLCRNENELAAVLAHEVGHVQLQHAIGAISNSRWTSAFTILGAEAGKNLGSEQLRNLTAAFEGSISDITHKLITSGYARSQEQDADTVAVTILQRVGYDPHALISLLQNMNTKLKPAGHDFAATHPPPADRIKDLQSPVSQSAAVVPAPPARQQRFAQAMAGI